MNSGEKVLKKKRDGRIKKADKYRFSLCLLIFTICFLKPSFSYGEYTFLGDIDVETVLDDNVYKDSRKYSDIGYKLELGLGVRSKFARQTFLRTHYWLGISGFSQYNLENETSHLLDATVKQRLSDVFDIELNGGFNLSQLPNASVYNSSRFYGLPRLKWYVFDRTTLSGGYIYEKTSYPDYNLDNQTNGTEIKIDQEFSLYTHLEVSGVIQNKTYPERYLYEGISGGSPTYRTDTRRDAENFVRLTLSQNLTAKTGFELIYNYGQVDSNENYFDWGPQQYEGNNTIIGDERIISDYRSYVSDTYGINFFTGFADDYSLSISVSYTDKDYSGRLAKDENDKFREPDQKRRDRQTFIFVSWSKNIFLLKYSYEINDSNDALYNYTNSVVSLGIRYLF